MVETKPRVRVPAGRALQAAIPGPRPTMRYLRDDKSGTLALRRAVSRDARADVWEAGDRAYALAVDFMHNSGWIAGAADQIIVDTIGTELKLNARPDFTGLGYSDKERADWVQTVERAWKRWAWTPSECDLAGKATVAEMADGVMRHYLAGGEGFGVLSYLDQRTRARYGVETGTKVSLVAPHRLPRRTLLFEGLDQGILHDVNGRVIAYRFRRQSDGLDLDEDIAARDGQGLQQVIHVMDRGDNPDSPRGISPMAPILKVIAQSDQLADATLATALLQTIFAATIQSPEPSVEAFQAIQTLATDNVEMPATWVGTEDDWDSYVGSIAGDLIDVWGQRIGALKEGGINLSDTARIGHMGPGEELKFHTAQTPGGNYLPFSQNLQREMARRLGIMFESLSMDFSGASYSSVRMGVSTIWPIAVRRRERIAAPFCQGVYEAWLDEQIAMGRIPFKGGYRAFAANRLKVTWAEWQGPAKPSADDYKSALAAKVRMETGVSSLADECAEMGRDADELMITRSNELKRLTELGLPSPFERMSGGGGPQGAAAEGNREPAAS
ncbi:phage portal protein [Aureimonas altamirensis]|uniref:Phage portal protein n=1 Tax=Aureimonas altamirensis TaxID=370622 RepID=A0A0B1QBU7_9HYPH|nr:phage portal protein [Aureimonas altamirensis]KHJ56295.1 phage portal protein [Aureimonas altamirensis]